MLKDTFISEGTLYLGRRAGREILEKIKDARHTIKIITPYISSEYIDLLKSKAQNGLKVNLIVSSDIGGEKQKNESFRKLISQKRHTNNEIKEKRDRYLKYVVYIFVMLIVVAAIGIYLQNIYFRYVLPIAPILYLARNKLKSLTIYTYSYFSELSLSIPLSPYTDGFNPKHTLVHAKVFIIDEEFAYIGSINFTKAAFWYNYESRIKLTQREAVSKLSQEFEYVYSNKNTEYLDISSMGKRLYSEPKN